MVLKGVLTDGLYQLSLTELSHVPETSSMRPANKAAAMTAPASCNFVSTANMVVTKVVWHQRLGHPAIKTLDSLVKHYNLPVVLMKL